MWNYVQCDLAVGWIWLLFLEELVRYLYGLTLWLFVLFLIYIMAEPDTRLSGVKQELSVFKSEFSSSFEKLKDSITVKFSNINARLDEIEKKNIKKSVTEEVNESIMSIKNTIIDALKEENLKLQNKVKIRRAIARNWSEEEPFRSIQ